MRYLYGRTTYDIPLHLVQLIALDQAFQVISEFGENSHRDSVDVRVLLEDVESVHNDRSAVDLQKLLRTRTVCHSRPHAAGEDYCDVCHWFSSSSSSVL